MRFKIAVCSPAWRSARRAGSRTWNRTDRKGTFTTLPLVVEGNRLLVNGQTDPGGSIRVEVQDAEGNPFPELGLDDCLPFSGDRVAHEVRWKRAKLEEVNGRVVRLRVVLEGARLYTFRIAS